MMPFVGAASVATIAVSNATLQLNSEPRAPRPGDVAVLDGAASGSTPIGGPIVGWIGEHIDPRVAVLLGGIAALVAAVYGAIHLGLRHRATTHPQAPIACSTPDRRRPLSASAAAPGKPTA